MKLNSQLSFDGVETHSQKLTVSYIGRGLMIFEELNSQLYPRGV